MNILGIDTSTKTLSLAVSRGGKTVRFRNQRLQRPLSSSIMPAVRDILEASGMALERLDGFAVGLGPGSFTSLRVGLATVKGLAFVAKIPVVGISSLDVLAMNASEEEAQVCVLCDAKRHMGYACVYRKTKSGLLRQSDYMLAGIRDILKHVRGKTVFIGDGAALFSQEIKRAKTVTPVFGGPKLALPQARHLITLASERFKLGKADNIDALVPMYLYPEHCQVRR